MEVKSLSDIASFNVAKYVWGCYIDENQVKEWPRKDRGDSYTIRAVERRLRDFEEQLQKLYPCLPVQIQHSILTSAYPVDKELIRWRRNFHNIRNDLDCVSWTPFFTIDRVRSSCKSKQFDLTSETLCECCYNAYVDNFESDLSSRDMGHLLRFFGNFIHHVILYWYWYGRENRSLMLHVHKYHIHYEHSKPLENIFKLSVFLEYEVAVFHYWSRLNNKEQRKYLSLVIPLLVFESNYLEFIEMNELLPIHTFSFFWNQLDNYERFDVIKYYLLDFYRYLLYHESGIFLIFEIFNMEWSPSIAPLEYFKLLRLANDTNNMSLFELLWKRKLSALSFEAIGHLLWTLLHDRDADYRVSVMLINDYDAEQKLSILNELDKRIECVHFDFNDRIDGFLTAASLEHLRFTGFPRNPRPRPSRPRNRRPRRFNRRSSFSTRQL